MTDARDPLLLGVELLRDRSSLAGKPPLSEVADSLVTLAEVPAHGTPDAVAWLAKLNGELARVSKPPLRDIPPNPRPESPRPK